MHIAVLGAGMVGSAMAIDLAKKYTVTSFDISNDALQSLKAKFPEIHTRVADLTDFSSYTALLKNFDYVISAVPGFMGYKALESIITAGKNVVDISFFPEDALQLHQLAADNMVTAITDCGVAPGISNLVLGYENSRMQVTGFECMVGGLPKKRVKPFEYKAPFSPIDVLEEYIRPARYMENGVVVTRPALSDAELIDFEKAGTLESFNTDGLRSLLFTMKHIPDMKEKTLRYPGHIDLIKNLKMAGFLNPEPVTVKGKTFIPMEFTSALLIDKWKLEADEEEFTIMKIEVRGKQNGKDKTVSYFLYDEYDAVTKTSSMARTTGYTCTAALHLLINGLFNGKGVYPPELIGSNHACTDFIFKYLEERNVVYRRIEN